MTMEYRELNKIARDFLFPYSNYTINEGILEVFTIEPVAESISSSMN